jgi:hypothetical protein
MDMTHSNRLLTLAILGAGLFAAGMPSAQAHDDDWSRVGLSIFFGAPAYSSPRYVVVPPPPVYYQQPPVYYVPASPDYYYQQDWHDRGHRDRRDRHRHEEDDDD